MNYYKNKNKEIFGFELDGSQDHLITDDMSPITLDEIKAINKAKENEYKQTVEYKIAEANAYLKDTDWVNDYKTRHDLGLDIIPEDSTKWAVIEKREEYKVFLKGAK